jgi:hypothetical protein
VIADADREQLHDLAAKVLLRFPFGVALAVEPHDHRGILRHLQQEIAKVAKRVFAEDLDLSLWPAQRTGLVRQHLCRLHGARVGYQLAVGSGEVVVPEQRHLLLQRPPRMDHAEHPALSCVVDIYVRREEIFRDYLRVIRTSDARVDVVRPAFVVDEVRHRRTRRHVAEDVDVLGADAESGATEQVVDFGVELRHSRLESDRQDTIREGGVVATQ